MNTITFHQCPHCEKGLYHARVIDGKIEMLGKSPELKVDTAGMFTICPHADCSKRVALEVVASGEGTPEHLGVASVQQPTSIIPTE